MFEVESPSASPDLSPIPMSELDAALTAQLVVAWAGEGGEEKRLGWWRCDLVSEFGGQDLFQRLLPSTWTWAVLQGAREAARRRAEGVPLDPITATSFADLARTLNLTPITG